MVCWVVERNIFLRQSIVAWGRTLFKVQTSAAIQYYTSWVYQFTKSNHLQPCTQQPHAMSPHPHVLISNDDGVNAPGLHALVTILVGFVLMSVHLASSSISMRPHLCVHQQHRQPVMILQCPYVVQQRSNQPKAMHCTLGRVYCAHMYLDACTHMCALAYHGIHPTPTAHFTNTHRSLHKVVVATRIPKIHPAVVDSYAVSGTPSDSVMLALSSSILSVCVCRVSVCVEYLCLCRVSVYV